MNVKKIISAILFASACVRSEGVDSADAEYCFDFRSKWPSLLLVKQHNAIEIRAAGDSVTVEERFMECGGDGGYSHSGSTVFDFIDESGKRITSFGGGYGQFGESAGGCLDCGAEENRRLGRIIGIVPTVIKIKHLQEYQQWSSGQERTTAAVSKDLLRFTGRVVNGHAEVSTHCKPEIDATYNVNFRAKITGKCTAEFLSGYDRSKRRGVD